MKQNTHLTLKWVEVFFWQLLRNAVCAVLPYQISHSNVHK